MNRAAHGSLLVFHNMAEDSPSPSSASVPAALLGLRLDNSSGAPAPNTASSSLASAVPTNSPAAPNAAAQAVSSSLDTQQSPATNPAQETPATQPTSETAPVTSPLAGVASPSIPSNLAAFANSPAGIALWQQLAPQMGTVTAPSPFTLLSQSASATPVSQRKELAPIVKGFKASPFTKREFSLPCLHTSPPPRLLPPSPFLITSLPTSSSTSVLVYDWALHRGGIRPSASTSALPPPPPLPLPLHLPPPLPASTYASSTYLRPLPLPLPFTSVPTCTCSVLIFLTTALPRKLVDAFRNGS